ncbi:MmgE/PrpD family protein, partial [Paracoccus sp. (in: a-proteobacteria)]|uniref:MmgE/PrpD family protein n=1 Tax=Paracoccus sp. TaxID=267 RepID=UPI00321FEDE8
MTKHAQPCGIQLPRPGNWADQPPELKERARYLLLDTIGTALAGRSADATLQVRTLMPRGAASPLEAALLLGTACQALDLDETNLPARCHIAAAVVPALIGAAMTGGCGGARFMEALLAAYAFEARLGQALAPRHGARGWHPSATLGVFGAAYGASLLMGLDEEPMRHALVIASTQAGGVRAVFGGTAKPFNLGRAAQSGLTAALLARSGMTAPGDPFLSPV